MQLFGALPEATRSLKSPLLLLCLCLVTPPLHLEIVVLPNRRRGQALGCRDAYSGVTPKLTALNLRIRSSYALAGTWR